MKTAIVEQSQFDEWIGKLLEQYAAAKWSAQGFRTECVKCGEVTDYYLVTYTEMPKDGKVQG